MPPKDAKGDKKKQPPPKPECVPPQEAKPPDEMSPQFYLDQIAELEECVERYQKLHKVLLEKSEELQANLVEQKEENKNAFIQAKKDFEDKVAEIAQLEEEVKEMELRIEKEKEEHKELMEQKAKEYVETEQELIAANQEIMDQLAVIEEFKLNREELEECIQSLEEEIAHREEVNQAQLEQQDREQVEGKNKLKKDILTHLTEVAAEHWRRADAALPTTTKRLLLENYQLNKRVDEMYAEIKLLQQQSVEWRAEDARQVGRMRELQTTNTATTNRNITINMVIGMMNAEISSIKDSVERFRPRDATKRSSLAEELQYMRSQLMESRENLVAASEQKENVEKEVFEQRYQLATQRAVRIQLQRAIRDSTSAVSRLLERKMHGDCVDVEHATERRGDLVVSMLSILKQARDHQLGPSLRAVVHPTQDNVCKYLGYQQTERYADVGYEPGDLGIVPHTHSMLPTRRDGMRLLQAAQEKQAHMLINELSRKPTDPTTTTRVRRRFFSGPRRESSKMRSALAASRAKFLLASRSTSKTTQQQQQQHTLPPLHDHSASTLHD